MKEEMCELIDILKSLIVVLSRDNLGRYMRDKLLKRLRELEDSL